MGDAENMTKCLYSMLSQRVVSVVVLYRWVAAKRILMFVLLFFFFFFESINVRLKAYCPM
jgi:hypothetical protein